NKTVIVPIYGLSQDTTALRIYREALPGYRIAPINCASMISALGAIHCITKEIGVSEPVFISHSKLVNTNNTSAPYEVKAYIKTKSGVANAKVYWTTDTLQTFSQLAMTASAGDTFRVSIPAQTLGTKIYYYISAVSNSGRTVTKPLTAPSGNFRFTIANPTAVQNSEIELNSFNLKQNYPNPFNPTTNLEFVIPDLGFVSLKVYDLSGKEVAVLVNEKLSPGRYKTEFKANNLPSGVYFVKMESGDFRDVKRMVLIK
ncbi:MAG: agmatine deiminase family protein, partial [Ignavibacteria bacterium]